MQGMNFAFPEMMLKNQRVTQLAKMAARSRRLCALQVMLLCHDNKVAPKDPDWCHVCSVDEYWRDFD